MSKHKFFSFIVTQSNSLVGSLVQYNVKLIFISSKLKMQTSHSTFQCVHTATQLKKYINPIFPIDSSSHNLSTIISHRWFWQRKTSTFVCTHRDFCADVKHSPRLHARSTQSLSLFGVQWSEMRNEICTARKKTLLSFGFYDCMISFLKRYSNRRQ